MKKYIGINLALALILLLIAVPVKATDIKVKIMPLIIGEVEEVSIGEKALVSELKKKIAKITFPNREEDKNGPNYQRLIYAGKPLENKVSIAQYGIKEGSTIHLAWRLRPSNDEDSNSSTLNGSDSSSSNSNLGATLKKKSTLFGIVVVAVFAGVSIVTTYLLTGFSERRAKDRRRALSQN